MPATRPPNRVLVGWRGDELFEAGRPGGPIVTIDGHGKESPSPVDLLLASLAACAAIDVVQILAKRRTPVASLDVETVGTRVDSTPRRLKHVLFKFTIVGAGIERIHAERAVELAVTKYCSVRSSLDPELPIEWDIEIRDS
jgi:putative redox protein